MVGHDALTAAEADVPEAQRLTPARDTWTGHEQRLQDMQHYLRRDGHGELSPQWQKLAEVAPPFWMAISECGRILSSLTRWGRCRKS